MDRRASMWLVRLVISRAISASRTHDDDDRDDDDDENDEFGVYPPLARSRLNS